MPPSDELKRLILTIQLLRPELRRRFANDRIARGVRQAQIGREMGVGPGRAGQLAARFRWEQMRGGPRPSNKHYRKRIGIALGRVGWTEREAFWAELEGEAR